MTRILSLPVLRSLGVVGLLILSPFSLSAGCGHSKDASFPPLQVQIALLTVADDKKVSFDEVSYMQDRKTKEYAMNRAPKDAAAKGEHTIKITRVDFNQKEKKAIIRYQTTTGSQSPENGETETIFGHTSERTELATTPPLYVAASILYLTSKD